MQGWRCCFLRRQASQGIGRALGIGTTNAELGVESGPMKAVAERLSLLQQQGVLIKENYIYIIPTNVKLTPVLQTLLKLNLYPPSSLAFGKSPSWQLSNMYQKPHRFVSPTPWLVQWWLHPPWVVSFQDVLRCLPPRHDTWSQRSGSRKLRFYQSPCTPESEENMDDFLGKRNTQQKWKQNGNKEDCFGHNKETWYLETCLGVIFFGSFHLFAVKISHGVAHLHCHITLLQQQGNGDGLHRSHPFEAHLGNKALRALTKGGGQCKSTTLIFQYGYMIIINHIFIYHVYILFFFACRFWSYLLLRFINNAYIYMYTIDFLSTKNPELPSTVVVASDTSSADQSLEVDMAKKPWSPIKEG